MPSIWLRNSPVNIPRLAVALPTQPISTRPPPCLSQLSRFPPGPPQNVRDLDGRPCSTARCRDATRRQRPSDASERFDATSLTITEHRQDVRRETVCNFLSG